MSSSINPTGGVTIGNMMPGLVSGLDTESMVEKLLSGTQAKIDKQKAERQQITWKQEIYRDIITKLDNFRTEYFTFSGNNNLLSSAFYNTMTSTSSSSAVKVISSSSRAATNVSIDKIDQLATAHKETSANPVTDAVSGTMDQSKFTPGDTYAIDVSLDGVKKTIRFEGGADEQGTIDNLNDSLKSIWGNTLQFQESGGTVTLAVSSDHNVILTENKDSKALKNLGFKDGTSNKLDYNTSLKDTPFKTALIGDHFTFSINGTEIKANANESLGDVLSHINNSDAGVRVTYSSVEDKFIIESKTSGAVPDFEIKQTEGNLLSAMFGYGGGSGISSTVSGLKNGDTITATGAIDTALLDTIIDAVNTIGGTQSLKLHINGQAAEVSVGQKEDGTPYTREEFIDALNEKLEKGLGGPHIKLTLDSATDTMSLKSEDGYIVSFDDTDAAHNLNQALKFDTPVTQEVDPATSTIGAIGLTGTINVKNATGLTTPSAGSGWMQEADGSWTMQLNGSWTLDEFLAKYDELGAGKLEFDGKNGIMKLTGVNGTGAEISAVGDAGGDSVTKKFFGSDSLTFNSAGGTTTVINAGNNAVLTVNGKQIERNSNEFELEGITIQLTETTTGPISLTTERNTDKIVDGLKEFVESYNKLVDELNGYLTEDANYRKYPPLTDDQKKEMSDKEVELWEEKAKQGLLRNDTTIESMLGKLRTVMYQTVESAGISLYDIGIEAEADYKAHGKLKIDEDKLNAALTTNAENIQTLFTDKDNGIGVMLSGILKDVSNVSSGSPGTLVMYAGAKTALNTENTLSEQLKDIDSKIKALNKRYENERTRYWKQFSTMEQALSQLNTQSSWITQQFSGN